MPHKHLFLVEDEPEFRRLIGAAARALGPEWTVDEHGTGAGALAALGTMALMPDLALVDIGLPDMSGIEVIRALRQRHSELPILVVSVIADQRSVLAAIRAGARGYLLKDDTELSLSRAMGQVLEGVYPISAPLARYLFNLATVPGSAAPAGPLPALTRRETELLQLLARGLSYAEAGEAMGVSLGTVRTHIRGLYRKLEVHSQVQAVIKAQQQGLLSGR